MDVSDFEKIRDENRSCYYIDKTLMIADWLSASTEVTLITRPRRFWKTLNMTMLQSFLITPKIAKGYLQGLSSARRSMPKK